MLKRFLFILFTIFLAHYVRGQEAPVKNKPGRYQSFGIQAGLSLLENPFVLYPVISLSYSKTLLKKDRHHLAILPQAGVILLPGIENKFPFSVATQYKYVSARRFEASLYAGINYQLRQLSYTRYSFDGTVLKNEGNYLHQFGPAAGVSAGYKLIKRKSYSISPNLNFSFIKLNKNYTPAFFNGYKPVFSVGVNLNTY